MKRLFIPLVSVIMMFAFSCMAFGESAKDAVKALKKLEARIEAGISFKDYAPALGDAKFETNLFLQSPEAKKTPELTESISKTIGHYSFAGTLWQRKLLPMIYYREYIFYRGGTGIGAEGEVELGRFLEQYPNIEEARTFALNQDVLALDKVIKIVWQEASNELDNAFRLLAK